MNRKNGARRVLRPDALSMASIRTHEPVDTLFFQNNSADTLYQICYSIGLRVDKNTPKIKLIELLKEEKYDDNFDPLEIGSKHFASTWYPAHIIASFQNEKEKPKLKEERNHPPNRSSTPNTQTAKPIANLPPRPISASSTVQTVVIPKNEAPVSKCETPKPVEIKQAPNEAFRAPFKIKSDNHVFLVLILMSHAIFLAYTLLRSV